MNTRTILLTLAILAPGAAAQCELDELAASDSAAFGEFGYSVSLAGDRALVGARVLNAAYVYELQGSTWVEVARLVASDASPAGDEFGHSVSLSGAGDRALVGARSKAVAAASSGAAYLFEEQGSGWVQVAKLWASDGATTGWLGHSVSLSPAGDRALLGAPGDDSLGGNAGAAYVYDEPPGGWADMTETVKVTASAPAVSDSFGYAVSLTGDRALVSAYQGDAFAGSAFVLEWTGSSWTEVAKLTASDATSGDLFGWSASLSGDRALIGAAWDDAGAPNSGSAYLFEMPPGGWVSTTETVKLAASDPDATDYFGQAVSLSGDRALVGAWRDDDGGDSSGSAYLFERQAGAWVEVEKLVPADASADDLFGYSVSLHGDRALVGAPSDDDAGVDAGSAYVFSTSPCAAAVLPYGCGVNPPGSLTLISGLPSIGTTITLGVDNPLGTQPAGSLPFLALAFQPDPAFPCGTPMPGWGMGGPDASGELLIPLNPPFVFAGPPWGGAGSPVPFSLQVPNLPSLFGFSAYVQGLVYDPTGALGVTFGLTGAVQLLVGP